MDASTNFGSRIGHKSGARVPGTAYFSSVDASTSIGAGSNAIKTDRISIAGAASDPGSLVAGDIWYRTDLGKFKFRNGSTAVDLLDASTGVAAPASPNTNDLIQRTAGGAWDAAGGTVGDPVLGTLYTSALTLVGTGNASPIRFNTDNANDIGANGANRPRTVYAATSMIVAGQPVVKQGDSAVGVACDLTGTYPQNITVAKVQGKVMTSGTPTKGDLWEYDGTNWVHAENRYRVVAHGTSSRTNAGSVDFVTYTPAANEFSNSNSLFKFIFEIYNPSGITWDVRAFCGGNEIQRYGNVTYNRDFVEIYAWNDPGQAATVGSSSTHGYQGFTVAQNQQSLPTGGFAGANALMLRLNVISGTGTVYVRGYVVEIRKE